MPISYFNTDDVDYVDHFNLIVDAVNAGGGGSGVTSVTATSPVVSSGGTTPVISIPVATTSTSGYLSNTDWNTFNGKAAIADITVTNLTGTVGFSKGGTGQTTQQAAMNALAAAVTTGSYLRGNGTNVVMSAIQAVDVPTLNQNTTGTAAIATTATTTNDVATASVVYPLWSSATSGNNGVKTSSTKLTFVPSTGTLTTTTFVGALTGNASTATSATNVTGTVAVANGGTGLTTLTSGSVLVGNGTSSPTLVAPSTSGNVLTSNGTTWVSSPATGGGSAITVKDEGSTLTSALTSLDFVGAGVSASNTGGAVTVTITGGGGSGGTVTSASVVSANGFAGSVANATTTPAITLSTTISGLLKGNGTAISAATSGTDYSAGTAALTTGILKSTTSTGALTIATAGDFPTLNQNTTGTAANVTGTVAVANGGTGVTSSTGSGSNVLSNTPTLVTPVLGVASATTINKVAITAPATGSTLTIADGKTLTANNSLTFSGTDASTLNIGTGGTLGTAAYTSSTSYAPAAGSASITTVGTISTGTWNGGVISGTYGGTGVNNGSSTLTLGGNHTNSGAYSSTFTFTGITNITFPTSGVVITTTNANLSGNSISGVKSLVMDTPETITTTTGAVTLDFSTGSLKLQNELTGAVTYTFTAPAAYSRIQIFLASDGTSSAYGITWPASVKWLGAAFTTTVANKAAMVNGFYDGTNYWMMGSSEV